MIWEDVLAKITPEDEEEQRIAHAVDEIMAKIRTVARDMGLEVEPILVGSVAKGTHLPSPDLDVFMMFPTDTSRKDLELQGLRIGRAVVPDGEERYAEHPYIHGRFGGFEIDLVPCYHIDDPSSIQSAVDRTPFHNEFVKANLGEGQRGQVRLLKRFMKGVGVYGAEAQVKGFSGYLCELLVIKYGGFGEVLEAAGDGWKPPFRLWLGEDGSREFDEPLVFIDPVDLNRNVASAVSPEALERFIEASRTYLDGPRIEFFFPNPVEPLSKDELKGLVDDSGHFFIAVVLPRPDKVDDVLYPQVDRCQRVLVQELERGDFEVVDSRYHVDKGLTFLIELASRIVSPTIRHTGPPEGHPNEASFLSKWLGNERAASPPRVEGKRWFVEMYREHPDAVELLTARIHELALGKNIVEALGSGPEILEGPDLVGRLDPTFLTLYFDRRMPWEW